MQINSKFGISSSKILIIIILISLFFRLYNFQKFQYWSSDEEIASAVVNRMVSSGKISLISPNSNTELTLGSAFHVISVPLFIIADKNPIIVLNLISLLAVATTFLVYFAGKLIKDQSLGLTASFLYASSFLVSLFDRRWWPLTLNSFLSALALVSLVSIVKKNRHIYFIPLAVTIGFAAHSDPSLSVIGLTTILVFMLLKIKPTKKSLVLFFLTILIFASPLIFFELRHPGSVTNPFIKLFTHQNTAIIKTDTAYIPKVFLETIVRVFLTAPSDFAESHFCSCTQYETPLGKNLAYLFILPIIVPAISLIKKWRKSLKEKNPFVILYIFLLTFTAGSIFYAYIFNKPLHQSYFTIIFPEIVIIFAIGLQSILHKKFLIYFVLFFIFIINIISLTKSTFRYPLSDKQELIRQISKDIPTKDQFSLTASNDAYFNGGGFTGLFILNNKHPQKSYIYGFYDWLYKAHSLYTVTPTEENQAIAIYIAEANKPKPKSLQINKFYRVGNIEGILSNQINAPTLK